MTITHPVRNPCPPGTCICERDALLQTPGGDVRISLQPAGAQLRLDVADQGAGISAEQLPRLFQAFERLDMDGAVEGTGIGLVISRKLAELMGGSLRAHSVAERGCGP